MKRSTVLVKKIVVAIEKDDVIRIEDEGRGMPTGMHESGVNTLDVIFRVLACRR
jgi:topoisomerase IV subunit B